MLRADVLMLRNLARTPAGRRSLLGVAIVLGSAAMPPLALTGVLLRRAPVVDALRRDAATTVGALFELLSVAPILVMIGAGMPMLRSDLYGAGHVPLLLSTPVSSLQIVWRAFVRAWATWSLFGVALAVPAAVLCCRHAGTTPASALLLGIALPLLLAPVLALLVLWRVAAARWFAGPRVRALLLVVPMVTGIGLGTALLFGLARGRQVVGALARWLDSAPPASSLLPVTWTLMPMDANATTQLLFVPIGLAVAGAALLFAAAGYRRSYECHLVAGTQRLLRTAGRAWPTTPRRSLFRKGLLESLRVRSNLGVLVTCGLAQLVWLGTDNSGPRSDEPAQTLVREVFSLLQSWHGLAVLLSTFAFLGVVGGEQAHVPLLATAPVSRRDLLASRRRIVAGPFVGMLLLAAFGAAAIAGTGLLAIVGFFVAALPVLLITFGALLAVGSWPACIRLHDAAPLANNLRSMLPALVLGLLGTGLIVAVSFARRWLLRAAGDGVRVWPFGADWGLLPASALLATCAWSIGLLVYWLGHRVAERNFEALFGPQQE